MNIPRKYKRYIHCLIALYCILASANCKKIAGISDPSPTPTAVFNEVWEVMNRHYSLFAVKSIKWDSIGNVYRSQLRDNMSDASLFKLIGNMLANLKDGHVALFSPADTSSYTAFYTTYPRNFNLQSVINTYLHNNYRLVGPVLYKVDNNIGYLYYRSFADPVTDIIIDSLITAVSATKGLIIDIRSNQGGSSLNAVQFFSRFIAAKKLAKYEVFKKGAGQSDFFEPQPYFVSPSGQFYGKPVCVLVNRECYSACNDFVLYMSGLSNTRLVGDQTGGGGGIPNEYLLQNGWKLRYTSTLTLSPAMFNIENGIRASVDAAISAQDEQNAKDPILEKAIQLLQ